jgi:PRC-barrel domain
VRAELTAIGLAIGLIGAARVVTPAPADSRLVIAQAAVPPTGMEDEKRPMTPEQRMQARFPQNVRVGDLISLPMLDDSARTLGHVREVVRTRADKIELIVAYGGFLGWGTRPVAVPIEVVGIQGRELASLDMPPSEYATAPTWHDAGAHPLPADAVIKIALARR